MQAATKLRVLSLNDVLSEKDSSVFNKQASSNLWSLVHSLICRLLSDSLLGNSNFMIGLTAATSVIGYLYSVLAAYYYSTHSLDFASASISAITLH